MTEEIWYDGSMATNVTNELMYELLKQIQAALQGHPEQFHLIREELIQVCKKLNLTEENQ